MAALYSERFTTFFCWSLFFCAIGSSMWTYRNGGRFEIEHQTIIPHYLSDRPVLAKIFDILHTEVPPDPGNFTARELSYFFDFLDVQAIVVAGKLGFAHLMSTFRYLFILLIVAISWFAYRRELMLDKVATTLLISLFLTAPPVFHYVFFHRTAKCGVALGLTALMGWATHLIGRKSGRIRFVDGMIIFLIASASMLFDMQGFFFVILASAALACTWLIRREKKYGWMTFAVLAAIAVHVLYKYSLGFHLIQYFNGYSAKMGIQSLDSRRIFTFDGGWPRAFELALDYFRNFSGRLSRSVALLLFVLMAGFNLLLVPGKLSFYLSGRKYYLNEVGILIVALGLAIPVMNFVSATKVDAIYWPAVRLISYALPTTALCLFAFAITTRRLLLRFPNSRRLVYVVLFALVVGNVLHLPKHKRILDQNGEGSTPPMEAMLEKLRSHGDVRFDSEEVLFYDARIKRNVRDEVYHALREHIYQR